MKTQTNLLSFVILLAITLSKATICPVYFQFPLRLIENNLYFNQHEWLRGLFTYSKETFEHGDARFYKFNSSYVDGYFSKDRIQVTGKPNTTLHIEIRNVPLSYITHTNLYFDDSDVSEGLFKQVDFKVLYDLISLDIQFYREEGGEPKAKLLKVQSVLSQKSQDELKAKVRTSKGKQDMEMLEKVLQFQLKKRLFEAHTWSAKTWFDVIPYGGQLLGGVLYQIFSGVGLPILSDDTFIYCSQFAGHDMTYFDKSEFQALQEPRQNLMNGRVQINQEDFNAEILRLHKSDKVWNLPLPQSIIETALDALKDKLKPFQGASSFSVQVFFSEDVFERFWDSDDYIKSNMKIAKDGNLTLQQNLGFYITTYDSEQNTIRVLTTLMKMNVKLQLQDQNRLSHSNKEKRAIVKIHHLHITAFQIYDENDSLLNMESMMALVGINLEANKFVETFEKDIWLAGLKEAALHGYIGDIYMESPKDTLGFHWIRLHVEATDNQSIAFILRFDVEEFLIDPYRYEAAYRIIFKDAEYDKVRAHYKDVKSTKEGCNDAIFAPYVPFFTQWCQEDMEGLNLDDRAVKRCLVQWNCIIQNYFSTFSDSTKLLAYDENGVRYFYRWRIFFIVNLVMAIAAYLILKFNKVRKSPITAQVKYKK